MTRSVFPLLIMLAAAGFEVGGDALIRKGLRGAGPFWVVAGFVALGTYGVVVNLLNLDFSRLLGAYVGFFALVSIGVGRLIFHESVAPTTWLGLAVILAGSLIIHVGSITR